MNSTVSERPWPKFVLEQYPFSSHYFTLEGGQQIHYLHEGKQNRRRRPTVVLLHGNPTWSYYWRHLVDQLRSQFEVVVPDHLGMGGSSAASDTGEVDLQQHIHNLVGLFNHLKIDQYCLVVHDWGGPIGLGLARRYPQQLRGLVVTNTAGFVSRDLPKRIALCRQQPLGKFLVKKLNAFARAATFMAVSKPLAPKVAKSYLYPYGQEQRREGIWQFLRDIPMDSKDKSFGEMKKIREFVVEQGKSGTPKLILWGGKDFCFHRGFFQQWKDYWPQARSKLYPRAGHYLMEDATSEVSSEIRQFLLGIKA